MSLKEGASMTLRPKGKEKKPRGKKAKVEKSRGYALRLRAIRLLRHGSRQKHHGVTKIYCGHHGLNYIESLWHLHKNCMKRGRRVGGRILAVNGKREYSSTLKAYMEPESRNPRFAYSNEKGGRKTYRYVDGVWCSCDTSGRLRRSKSGNGTKLPILLPESGRDDQRTEEEVRLDKFGFMKEKKPRGKKARRTSLVAHYCRAHGRFVGYQWGGHRRTCVSTEISEMESLKLKGHGIIDLGSPSEENGRRKADTNGHLTIESAIDKLNAHVVGIEDRKKVIVSEMLLLGNDAQALQDKICKILEKREGLDKELNKLTDEKNEFLEKLSSLVESK